MPLSKKTRLKLDRVVFIVLTCVAFAIYNAIYERVFLTNFPGIMESGLLHSYTLTGNLVTVIIVSLASGIVLGVLEVFVFEKRATRSRFGRVLTMRTLLYCCFLLSANVLSSFVFNTTASGEAPWSPHVLGEVREFLFNGTFLYAFIPWCLLLVLIIAVIQVSNIFGPGLLLRFVSGRYFNPTEEFRVFMFLDVKSSTTLAEEMGNIKYFRFISQFIEDATDAIHEHDGEIYKYVGDEIIISWTESYASSCIPCFHAVEDAIAAASDRYRDQYGHVPEFKAGVHCGLVIVGEIGVLKKEIGFSGDVLNSAARIQALCNEYGHSLLVSDDVLKRHTGASYETQELGHLALRGKVQSIPILGVQRYAGSDTGSGSDSPRMIRETPCGEQG